MFLHTYIFLVFFFIVFHNVYADNYGSLYKDGCKYVDGVIYENGVAHQATEQQIQEIEEYKKEIREYWKQFREAFRAPMREWNERLGALQQPHLDCFCSPEACEQNINGISQSNSTISDIID